MKPFSIEITLWGSENYRNGERDSKAGGWVDLQIDIRVSEKYAFSIPICQK
jgi:hypothetical protein